MQTEFQYKESFRSNVYKEYEFVAVRLYGN